MQQASLRGGPPSSSLLISTGKPRAWWEALPCAREDGKQAHLYLLRDEGTSCPSESSHVVPPDVERLLGVRLLFIFMSVERTRKYCTNGCSQRRSQVAPEIGTAVEKKSGCSSSVPRWQGRAGGEQEDTPAALAISRSNSAN